MDISRDDINHIILRAQNSYKEKRYERSIQAASEAMSYLLYHIIDLNEAIRVGHILIKAYGAINKYDEAIQYLKVHVFNISAEDQIARKAQDIDEIALNRKRLSIVYSLIARIYYEANDWIHTASEIKVALDLDPSNIEALSLQSCLCASNDDYKSAVDYIAKALAINPSFDFAIRCSSAFRIELAQQFIIANNYNAAFEQFEEGLKFDVRSHTFYAKLIEFAFNSDEVTKKRVLNFISQKSFISFCGVEIDSEDVLNDIFIALLIGQSINTIDLNYSFNLSCWKVILTSLQKLSSLKVLVIRLSDQVITHALDLFLDAVIRSKNISKLVIYHSGLLNGEELKKVNSVIRGNKYLLSVAFVSDMQILEAKRNESEDKLFRVLSAPKVALNNLLYKKNYQFDESTKLELGKRRDGLKKIKAEIFKAKSYYDFSLYISAPQFKWLGEMDVIIFSANNTDNVRIRQMALENLDYRMMRIVFIVLGCAINSNNTTPTVSFIPIDICKKIAHLIDDNKKRIWVDGFHTGCSQYSWDVGQIRL